MASVLVVEDDPDVLEMMLVFLASEGYAAVGAANGLEALQSMRERRPCLVLLDINMPVMDGWEFRRQQLDDPAISRVPVVGVTAAFDPRDVAAQLKVRCLAKPVSFEEVLGEVAAVCEEAPIHPPQAPVSLEVLQRIDWWGDAVDLGECFRLTRGGRVVVCRLYSHSSGWELRLEQAGVDPLRTQVCQSHNDVVSTSESWKGALIDSGWR